MNALLFALSIIIGSLIILCGFIAQKYPNVLSETSKPSHKPDSFSALQPLKTYTDNIKNIGYAITIGGIISAFINSEILFLTTIIAPFFFLCLINLWKKRHQKKSLIPSAILCITFVSIPLFIIYASKEVDIYIDEYKIELKGLYRATIKSSEIEEISLCDKIPVLKRRDNGFSFNKIRIGHYTTKDNQKIFLFCYGKNSPFIHIQTKSSKNYFINLKEEQKTIDIYHKLQGLSISY